MKQNETFGLVLIIGVLIIAMGSTTNATLTIEDKFHTSCIDLVENEIDGDIDLFFDRDCQDYPYNDGSGENTTDIEMTYSEGQQNYDVYNDFFEYANYSYSDIVIATGYPGTIEDYRCDLIDMGSTNYIRLYDIAFGTNIEGDINAWYQINCVQAGNSGALK